MRKIDWLLDFDAIRAHLADLYSHTGRPSVDSELMLRMLLVGYLYGIRSERRLVEESHLNLAYRWFCKLGLEGHVPDRSTFSKNRHVRFSDGDVIRHLFESVVETCVAFGFVGGTDAAVDGSTIEADANRDLNLKVRTLVSPMRHRQLAPWLHCWRPGNSNNTGPNVFD